mmetsp:Transcript_92370/g.247113  ORF Transcript_92370/g.247113 Transcript_92370/m.247113 type:complete len:247 (+) Transcript_92370:488-1228(+)
MSPMTLSIFSLLRPVITILSDASRCNTPSSVTLRISQVAHIWLVVSSGRSRFCSRILVTIIGIPSLHTASRDSRASVPISLAPPNAISTLSITLIWFSTSSRLLPVSTISAFLAFLALLAFFSVFSGGPDHKDSTQIMHPLFCFGRRAVLGSCRAVFGPSSSFFVVVALRSSTCCKYCFRAGMSHTNMTRSSTTKSTDANTVMFCLSKEINSFLMTSMSFMSLLSWDICFFRVASVVVKTLAASAC